MTQSQIDHPKSKTARAAFTLVELLVVIGIIAVLIAMLLPTLGKARKQANSVACASNLAQIGKELLMYSQNNNGWLFPPLRGADKAPWERWPAKVFKMKYPDTLAGEIEAWQPNYMTCPQDLEPMAAHSYVLNDHLFISKIKYNTKTLGKAPYEIVVMGEKVTGKPDYYMNASPVGGSEPSSDYETLVHFTKHGLRAGANYLYMDMSVAMNLPKENSDARRKFIDPWDVTPEPVTP